MADRIGVTSRVARQGDPPEERDCLAADWRRFMARAFPDVAWMPLPNVGAAIRRCAAQWALDGFILTGGDNLGDSAERDATERALLDFAVERGLPVIGICRGLQMIQHHFGGPLVRCSPEVHVAKRHVVRALPGAPFRTVHGAFEVNSFHRMGVPLDRLAAGLTPWAAGDGGLAEAAAHVSARVAGVQWHPERADPSDTFDRLWMRAWFNLPEL